MVSGPRQVHYVFWYSVSKRPDAGVIPFTPRYCIGACMGHREFFVQKAMGWVLRDYARTDPGEVRRYVAANGSSLSRLTRRETLKSLS